MMAANWNLHITNLTGEKFKFCVANNQLCETLMMRWNYYYYSYIIIIVIITVMGVFVTQLLLSGLIG